MEGIRLDDHDARADGPELAGQVQHQLRRAAAGAERHEGDLPALVHALLPVEREGDAAELVVHEVLGLHVPFEHPAQGPGVDDGLDVDRALHAMIRGVDDAGDRQREDDGQDDEEADERRHGPLDRLLRRLSGRDQSHDAGTLRLQAH